MFRNYVLVAFRNMRKYKINSIINIIGLSIGIAGSMLLAFWVYNELNYDKQFQDHERIHRIWLEIKTKTSTRQFSGICPPVAPLLKEKYPQVEETARIIPAGPYVVYYKQKKFYERSVFYADKELLSVFSYHFLRGNPKDALERPNTAVLTESTARKYFGDEDPLQKIIKRGPREFEITGVIKDLPQNTHFKFDFLLSLKTLESWGEMQNWHSTMSYTYVKLRENVNVEQFEQQISLIKYENSANGTNSGKRWEFSLQKVSDIHLYSHTSDEMEPSGNPFYVYLFMVIALVILILASLNFVNVSVATAISKAREIGIRKVNGAGRKDLIKQYLLETLLYVIISFFIALLLLNILSPLLGDTVIGIADMQYVQLFLFFILFVIIIGVVAGIYPAIYLSSFKPADVIKGREAKAFGKLRLSTLLVIFQFAITAILIISTLMIHWQVNYMKNQNLGFRKDRMLVLAASEAELDKNHSIVKNEFGKVPGVLNVTASGGIPGFDMANFGCRLLGEEAQKNVSMYFLFTDYDFIDLYELEVITGRKFDRKITSDLEGSFIINESVVRLFGWKTPDESLGRTLRMGWNNREGKIIGVVKDFHYKSLVEEIEPLILFVLPDGFRTLTLKVSNDDLQSTVAAVSSKWGQMFPKLPFEYSFLDDSFNRQYKSEEESSMIFTIFTILAIFISCLGLFGLSLLLTQYRTKEIGIRKIFGATVCSLLRLYMKSFMKWILFANLLAWPLAYYIILKWLDNFAYRTSIKIEAFAIATILTIVFAFVAIAYSVIKSSIRNPVEALRYE